MSEVLAPLLPEGTPPIPVALTTSTITDPATFRSHFPEFSDTTIYPDPQVQFFIDIASASLSPCRWGSALQMGVELFTAHMLAMSRASYVRSQGGAAGVPGAASGLMNSKSVSKVSVGYDVNVTAIEGGGPWNYTSYGQRFLWWLRLFGMGGYETLAEAGPWISPMWTWSQGVMYRWGS